MPIRGPNLVHIFLECISDLMLNTIPRYMNIEVLVDLYVLEQCRVIRGKSEKHSEREIEDSDSIVLQGLVLVLYTDTLNGRCA